MVKRRLVMTLLVILLFLTGCENNTEELDVILADDLINMTNLDEYMFRDDVQYVDLRNYDASFRTGFIYSFEIIPFFDYLDYRAFDRNDGYEFNPDQILSERELERLFDRDKAIFLYADGCIRSGYLKDVLNYMGYDRVFILGGFYEYHGEYNVLGDGYYSIGNTFYNSYFDEDLGYTYYVYGTYDMGRKITEIRFDIVDDQNVSLRTSGYDLSIDYNEQLTNLEIFVISDIVTMNELYEIILLIRDRDDVNIPGYILDSEDGIKQLIHGLISY